MSFIHIAQSLFIGWSIKHHYPSLWLTLPISDPPLLPLLLVSFLSLSQTSLAMLIPQVIKDTIHMTIHGTKHSGEDCVWDGEMSFPPSDPISPSGACTASSREKIRWKCNHNQLRSRRGRTHTHEHMQSHAHRRINIYSISLLQGSHAENCFGHGDEEKGVWGVVSRREGSFLIYIFNVKYHSKRES